jgi:hypothetical protein
MDIDTSAPLLYGENPMCQLIVFGDLQCAGLCSPQDVLQHGVQAGGKELSTPQAAPVAEKVRDLRKALCPE